MFLFLFSLVLGQSLEQEPIHPAFKEIHQIVKDYKDDVGISIRNSLGRVVYSKGGDKNFVPASVAKLLSTACVMKELGPDYQFVSTWYAGGPISGGVLQGDLIIDGTGDFSFVVEDLKVLVEKLRYVWGIKEIKGDLVFDTSYLETPAIDISDEFEGDRGRAFKAKITAAPINHNAFEIHIRSDEPKPHVSIFPFDAVELNIHNTLRTGLGRLNGAKTMLDYRPETKKLIVSGLIGKNDPVKVYYRSLIDPYDSYARLFRYAFGSLGGSWKGKFKVSSAVSGKKELMLEHRSRSLSRLMIDVNKLSTNLGAEMMGLRAAASKYGEPTSFEKQKKFLTECMSEMGLEKKAVRLENSSGLTRGSSIQPNALSLFLHALRSKDFYPEYLSSLSVNGRDGTTRKRLTEYEGKARLKTGSLQGVKSIAGYVDSSSGETWSVAIFLNCATCSPSKWKQAEDDILSSLMRR